MTAPDYSPEQLNTDSFSRLMDAYGDHTLLTKAEEQDLAKRIEQGDLAAKDTLVTSNLRLVLDLATDYRSETVGLDDTVQSGIIGLIRATEKFDWRRNLKFSTYAVPWIRQAMQRHIHATQRPARIPENHEVFARKLSRIEEELQGKFGRQPTEEELSEATEMTIERISELRQATRSAIYLDHPVDDNGETPLGEFFAHHEPSPDQRVPEELARISVYEAIRSELTEEEQLVIHEVHLNGFDGNREEAAKSLGMTTEELIHIETDALARLNEVVTGGDQESFRESWHAERPLVSQDALKGAVRSYKLNYPDMKFLEIGNRLGLTERQANRLYHEIERQMPDDPQWEPYLAEGMADDRLY